MCVFGVLSVCGGVCGGNGGFIEILGGWLDVWFVWLDVSVFYGCVGIWLFDFYNIIIIDGGSGIDIGYDVNFMVISNDVVISLVVFVFVLNQNINVMVFIGIVGFQVGNIMVINVNIFLGNGVLVMLMLQVVGDIIFDNVNLQIGNVLVFLLFLVLLNVLF